MCFSSLLWFWSKEMCSGGRVCVIVGLLVLFSLDFIQYNQYWSMLFAVECTVWDLSLELRGLNGMVQCDVAYCYTPIWPVYDADTWRRSHWVNQVMLNSHERLFHHEKNQWNMTRCIVVISDGHLHTFLKVRLECQYQSTLFTPSPKGVCQLLWWDTNHEHDI